MPPRARAGASRRAVARDLRGAQGEAAPRLSLEPPAAAGKADAVKGGRVGKAQSELILANQARDEKLVSRARARRVHALLDENQEEYKRLRARARKAFGGYGSFMPSCRQRLGRRRRAESRQARGPAPLETRKKRSARRRRQSPPSGSCFPAEALPHAFPLWLMFGVVIVIIHGVFLVATHFEPSQYPTHDQRHLYERKCVCTIYFMGMAGSGGAANRSPPP
ncbi:MAG: hypothetical protein R3F11_17695 [Verrucomicrobiales bacterium]